MSADIQRPGAPVKADERQVFMPPPKEVVGREFTDRGAVRHDLIAPTGPNPVGHEPHRRDRGEAGPQMRRGLVAVEQDAAEATAQVPCGQFVDAADKPRAQVQTLLLGRARHATQQLLEGGHGRVLRTAQNQKQHPGARCRRMGPFAVPSRPEIDLLHRLADRNHGAWGHPGVIVEHARHGGGGHANNFSNLHKAHGKVQAGGWNESAVPVNIPHISHNMQLSPMENGHRTGSSQGGRDASP